MTVVEIGDKKVGEGQPVYVIGEIGSNHDGNIDQARHLIRVVADAGADAAKFQLFRPDKLYPGQYTRGFIPDEWLGPLQDTCWDLDIEFLCSVFDLETLEAYLKVDPPAIKIASPEAADISFVKACSDTDTALIISTGAMSRAAVDRMTQEACPGWVTSDVVLLHCVSAYPADPTELNLRCIPEMAARYGVPVGFSDHTLHATLEPSLAVAAGACMIEKHVTLDRSGPTADAPFALEPNGFRIMVEDIRHTEQILGDGVKRVQPSEDPTDRR